MNDIPLRAPVLVSDRESRAAFGRLLDTETLQNGPREGRLPSTQLALEKEPVPAPELRGELRR